MLLCDAQTSGGLLMSVAEERVEELLSELAARDVLNRVIGTVTATEGEPIQVTP